MACERRGVCLRYQRDDPTVAQLGLVDGVVAGRGQRGYIHLCILHYILPDHHNHRSSRHKLILATKYDSVTFFEKMLFKNVY